MAWNVGANAAKVPDNEELKLSRELEILSEGIPILRDDQIRCTFLILPMSRPRTARW